MNPQMLVDLSAENLVAIVAERTYNAIAHAWTLQNEAHSSTAHEADSETVGDPHIVITGGRTGLAIAKALDLAIHRGVTSNSSFADKKVHIWFSDERFVGHESNDRSDSTLIAGFARSSNHCVFHRVATPGETSLAQAAAAYAAELDTFLTAVPEGLTAVPEGLGGLPEVVDSLDRANESAPSDSASQRPHSSNFAVTILSMGEDGHIASLFPGHHEALNSTLAAVAVDNSPKPPAQRVSISVDRLAASSTIYIFAVGESKREPLRAIVEGADSGPISALRAKFAGNQFFMVTDIRL